MSQTTGLIQTHRGNPTVKKYVRATVYVDYCSDFTYVHLMSKNDSEATVEAKLAFESIYDSYGVKALHYHVDNGLFDTKHFKGACYIAKLTLRFCGVKAHDQNGESENRIKDVTIG